MLVLKPELFDDKIITPPPQVSLLVIDLQAKLLPAIPQAKTVAWNVRRLLDAAKEINISAFLTEQYPQGLGETIPEIRSYFSEVFEKTSFSCFGNQNLARRLCLEQKPTKTIYLCGVETHVCVAQTALDALAKGAKTYIVVDAIGSRHKQDQKISLRSLESAGAILTTTEAVFFEWCADAKNPAFKKISVLAKETRVE